MEHINNFDKEEMRIFNSFVKVIDISYGYNKINDVKSLLEQNGILEVRNMLCDIIENMEHEKELLIAKVREEGILKGTLKGKLEGELEGELKGKLETAQAMLHEGIDIEVIMRCTNLSKEQIIR